MTLLGLSFFAGILTVLAPCVFPLLPVIIGGSLSEKDWRRPIIITLSLAVSVVLFTLALQGVALVLDIPDSALKWLSGSIVIIFGLSFLFPSLWAKVMHFTGIEKASQQSLQNANKKSGVGGMILMGMSLGPVFSSCSPTYGYIVATVLRQDFWGGLTHLIAYAIGLALVLGIVAAFGQLAVSKLKWAIKPDGWFRKILGILFLIVGVAIILGLDKQFEAWVIANFTDTFIGLVEFEQNLVDAAVE